MESNNFFVKNKSILTFLILEVVALTAFNFGNVSFIFGIAGGVLALFGALFVIMIEKNKKDLLWILIPVVLLLVIGIIGTTNGMGKRFNDLSNISLLVSLPGFLLLGFFLRRLEDVKPKTVLIVIGAGLAGITLFGLVSTLIEYGPLYSLIYEKKGTPLYYYNGVPYDVTKEMYWLTGFEFSEVYIEYGSLFAVLCASFLPGLLFISPKKDRNEFIISCAIGGIGLLILLLLPNFKGLVIVIIASSFAFIVKFLKNYRKVQKIIGFSFLGIVLLVTLFFVLALINAKNGFTFKGFFNRLFVSNRIMQDASEVMAAAFTKVDGDAVNFWGISNLTIFDDTMLLESKIFEVELLKEVGLVGTILFALFLFSSGYFIYRYIKNTDDGDMVKSTFIVMLLSFFIYESLYHLNIIGPHFDESYLTVLRSPLLLVVLFIIGYIFTTPKFKEKKKHE